MKFLALCLFVFSSFSITYAQKESRLKNLDKKLEEILEVSKAAGFSVAIVEGDKVIYAKGFGYSDYENKKPADENTIFAIGSTTKAFTSAILGQLRDEDKISFNDSPIKYIPELTFYNDEMNNQINIVDLMSHRTGLPRHDYSWYFFPINNKDSLLQRVEFHEPFTGVREQWYYNNFMFLAQGVIAERITDKSWEENIEERFFKPLNMNRSSTTIDGLQNGTNAAIGYGLVKDSIYKMDYYDIAGMSPAGSINSSAKDMSNWLITWLNDGKFEEQEFLSSSYINEAISSHMVIGAGLPDKEFPDLFMANYGYGWMMSSYKGHYRVEHGGNIDGFSANVALFPSDNLGIVVLANQNGSAVPNLVRNTVADLMLKTEVTDWAKRLKERTEKAKKMQEESSAEAASSQVKNTRSSHISPDFTGKYEHAGYGDFTITLENDSLFANLKRVKFYLKHYHYDIFEPFEVTENGIDTTESANLLFNFTTNNSGDIATVNLSVEPTLSAIEFKRTPNSIEVDKATLEQYVGDYELGGMELKVYIKNENTLYLFVPGQPEYELMATDTHKFSFKALEGFKVEFTSSDEKNIDAVNVIQPQGTFTAKKK